MLCPTCRKQNPSSAAFCTNCGTKLPVQSVQNDSEISERLSRLERLFKKYVSEGSLSEAEISEISLTDSSPKLPTQTQVSQEPRIQEPDYDEIPTLGASTESEAHEDETKAQKDSSKDHAIPVPRRAFSLPSIDFDLGVNWLAIVGGLMVVLALALISFAVYTAGGEVLQLILLLVIGSSFLTLGEFTRGKYKILDQVFSGIGISVIYAVVYATISNGRIDPILGLVLLGTVGLSGGYIAIRSNGMWIAILGVTGVFASPFIIDYGAPEFSIVFFIAYLIIMDIAVLVVSTHRNWKALNQISLWGSYLFIYITTTSSDITESKIPIIASLIIVNLIFFGVTSFFHIIRRENPSFQDLTITISNTVIFYISCILILSSDYPKEFAAINLWLAAINTAIGIMIYRSRESYKNYGIIFISQGAVFLIAFFPIYASGISTTIVWSLMAASTTYIGLKTNEWKWRLYSSALYCLAFLKLSFFDIPNESIPYRVLGLNSDNWLVNNSTITLSIFLLSCWIAFSFYKLMALSSTTNHSTEESADNELTRYINDTLSRLRSEYLLYEGWRPLILSMTSTLYLWIFSMYHISGIDMSEGAITLVMTAVTGLYGVSIIYIAIRRQNIPFRILGNVLVVISSGIGLIGILAALDQNPANKLLNPVFACYTLMLISIGFSVFLQYKAIWPIGEGAVFNKLSSIGNQWTIELHVHILPVITFFAIGYQLFTQFAIFGNSIDDLTVTLYFALYSSTLIYISKARIMNSIGYSKTFFQLAGYILLSVTIFKLVSSDLIIANDASRNYEWDGFLGFTGYQMVPILNPYFLLVSIITILILINLRYGLPANNSTNIGYTSLAPRYRTQIAIIMAVSAGFLILFTGTRELILWFEHANLARPPVVLSIYWALYSISIILLGMKLKRYQIRLAGLLLLAIPVLKIFTYDAWTTANLLGFISLFILGCLLLGMSYIYQRNRSLVVAFLSENENNTKE